MQEILRRHQRMMLEMLCEVDRICRKHDIRYQLFAGTALGCIRHGGFIPWDDDLDVVMLRPDYDRFLAVAGQELDTERYFLQAEFGPHWPLFFSKLRRNGTACLEKTHPKDPEMHQGVYIDLFPCDNLSDRPFTARLQFAASKIVIAKSLDRRGYLTDSRKKKAFILLCRLLPLRPFLRLTQLRGRENTRRVHVFLGGASHFGRSVLERAWMEETERRPFEDGEYPVSKHYDALLRQLYGDYLRLPPESERSVKVHSMLTDLTRPYTDYLDWQQRQRITEYTRSIR